MSEPSQPNQLPVSTGPLVQDLVDQCQSLEGLSPDEQQRAGEALRFLLSEQLIATSEGAVVLGQPLAPGLVNAVPWTRKWLIWLAEAWRECRGAPGASSLLARLRDSARHDEGVSVLRVSDRLRRAGFGIGFDERPPGSEKHPDLALSASFLSEQVHVEVTKLNESNAAREASATSWAIMRPLLETTSLLDHCGRIHKCLAPLHRTEVAGQVAALATRAQELGRCQDLAIRGVLELAVAPAEDRAALTSWATERDLQVNGLSGPPFFSDEATRVNLAVGREQVQLPRNRASLVVVHNSALFWSPERVSNYISTMEEELFRHPQLAAVVVSGTHAGGAEPANRMEAPHAYFCYTSHDFVVEHHIVLLNRFCSFPVPPALLARLYSAFAEPLE